MANTFHKDRIYRVKEKVDRNGRKAYIVQSARNQIDAICGLWNDYVKNNETLNDAIEQIEFIDGYKLVQERIVHKEHRK